MITDPLFYLVAAPAVALIGLAKGGFGGAAALVGVPIMALAVAPVTAAGILLPILVVMDVVALAAWRGVFDAGILRIMLPAAIAGIVLGYFTAALIPGPGVRLAIGLLSLWYATGWFITRNRPRGKPSTALGIASGTLSGLASFVAHAGGPPFQGYVLSLKPEPAIFAGTAVIFFAVVNAAKLVPYFLLGQFSGQNLATSAVLLPLAPVATLAGARLVKRIDRTLFYNITYGLLVPIGLKLVYDGVGGLAQ